MIRRCEKRRQVTTKAPWAVNVRRFGIFWVHLDKIVRRDLKSSLSEWVFPPGRGSGLFYSTSKRSFGLSAEPRPHPLEQIVGSKSMSVRHEWDTFAAEKSAAGGTN